MNRRVGVTLLTIAGLAIFPGCVSAVKKLEQLEEHVQGIEPGVSTRHDIERMLGQPSLTYEDSRLVVYIFRSVKNDLEIGENRTLDDYDPQLVVEYGESDIVLRHTTLIPP